MQDPLDKNVFDQTDTSEYKHYKSFLNTEEARGFAEVLDQANIPYTIESSEVLIDKAIVGTGLLPKAIIKIDPQNFKRVNDLIADQIEQYDVADFEDHYLNQLDDDELLAIFSQPEEWSVEDTNIAKLLLRGRGIVLTDEAIEAQRAEKLTDIRAGKKGSKVWMTIYFLCIVFGTFISLILVIAGIGMGYYYGYSKSVDPDGEKYYTFEEETRMYGKFILYGGTVLMLVVYYIVYNFLYAG